MLYIKAERYIQNGGNPSLGILPENTAAALLTQCPDCANILKLAAKTHGQKQSVQLFVSDHVAIDTAGLAAFC